VLTRHLLRQGVTDNELLELDLAQLSRNGELIDTYRGRLIVPVQRDRGRIDGFIGRDITGDPRAPKYRNPTRTPTFDKSRALYRPTHQGLDRDANVVVIEGAIDALAIASTAARGGELSIFAPATTSGVTVSGVQARAVLARHPKSRLRGLRPSPLPHSVQADRSRCAATSPPSRIVPVTHLATSLATSYHGPKPAAHSPAVG